MKELSKEQVSIPYGTIKSFFSKHLVSVILVSIPYGTIKRMLKKFEHQQAYDVSIPYGTIKSWKYGRVTAELVTFQFLMVRLKAV